MIIGSHVAHTGDADAKIRGHQVLPRDRLPQSDIYLNGKQALISGFSQYSALILVTGYLFRYFLPIGWSLSKVSMNVKPTLEAISSCS